MHSQVVGVGFELIARYYHAITVPAFEEVLFVLASGFMQPEQKRALDEAGLEFFIQKAYLSSALLRTLQMALHPN